MEAAVLPSSARPPPPLPFHDTKLFRIVMQVLSNESSALPGVSSTTPLPPLMPHSLGYTEEGRLALIIGLGILFAVLTTVGNAMVLISFKIDRQLQTISNYFLFSLAVADITIGIISIPLMTYYIAMRMWGIGYTMCQFWLCVDYLMSNASVMNLLLISFDRYFSVTRPLSYRPRRTTKKALTMIACTYIISLILWPPWIISWPYIEGKFTTEPGSCVVQFLETNPYVTVGTAIAAFYLPVTIMCVLYTRVYWETQKRQREFGKLQAVQNRSMRRSCKEGRGEDAATTATLVKSSSGQGDKWPNRSRFSWLRSCTRRSALSSEDSSELAPEETSLASSFKRAVKTTEEPSEIERNGSNRSGGYRSRNERGSQPDRPDTYTVLIELKDESSRPSVKLSNCEELEDSPSTARMPRSKSGAIEESKEKEHHPAKRMSSVKDLPRNGRFMKALSGSTDGRKSERERKKNERKQESKAAKTLSAILLAFVVTWTPYNLIVCWEAFFPRTVPNILFTISYCLCYINSTINPLCYALCNARFRHTYKRILRCNFKAERPQMNRNTYIRRAPQ